MSWIATFLAVLRGEADRHRERAFSFPYAGGADALATVTEGNWQATFFGSSNTLTITPVLISKLSKVLHVKPGRMISVE